MASKVDALGAEIPAWVRWFVWSVLACACILAIWAIALTADRTRDIARFVADGWPDQYAGVIVDNKIRALWHAAFMTFCAGGALWGFLLAGRREERLQTTKQQRGRKAEQRQQQAGGNVSNAENATNRGLWSVVRSRNFIAWALALLVAIDAWLLSRDYVKTMPMSALDENPVISLLKKDMPERRVALITQDGFYNWWLTYLFPYHGILSVNITQMPRMPTDYKNFLTAVGRNPVRMWELSAVGYVLAPAQVWQQIQRDPAWSNAFEWVYSYNVAPADPRRVEAGYTVYPATPQYPGQHVVLRLRKPAPRFALIGKYQVVEDEEALKLLGSIFWKPFEAVLIAPGEKSKGLLVPHNELSSANDGMAGAREEDWAALTNAGFVGSCKLERYRSGRMELSVEAQQPAILRISEKFDKDWKAFIDGKSTTVYRVDYIVQGVFIPAGSHRVLLQYAPPIWGLYVQLAGFAICLLAIGWLVVEKVRRRRT